MVTNRVMALATAGLVGAAVAVVAAPGSAVAATIVVDTTLDVVNGVDGVTSLREAFTAANGNGVDDSIQLAGAATYDLTSCASGVLEHTEDQVLTIEANGSTIRQTCPDAGVLASTDPLSSIVVLDAVIEGGPNTGVAVLGAGIFTDGRLELEGSTVTGVDAGPGGSVIDGAMSGGLYTLSIVDSSIIDNAGHAVKLSFGSVLVSASTISGNSGDGVGLTDGSPLTVTDSVIVDNGGRGASTTGMGTTQMTVSGSTISGNGGGGVGCNACGLLTITDTSIEDNGALAALGTGGGVSFTVDQDDPSDAPRLEIEDSTIDGNVARRAGGGVRVGITESTAPTAPTTLVILSNSVVSNNSTLGDGVPGGGIAVETGSLAMAGVEVLGNQAGVGGVASTSHGGGVFFRESAVDEIADPHDLQFAAVEISANTAKGRGGGMEVSTAGRIEVDRLTLSDNTAATVGGGAYLQTETSIERSVVDGNAAVRGRRPLPGRHRVGELRPRRQHREQQHGDGTRWRHLRRRPGRGAGDERDDHRQQRLPWRRPEARARSDGRRRTRAARSRHGDRQLGAGRRQRRGRRRRARPPALDRHPTARWRHQLRGGRRGVRAQRPFVPGRRDVWCDGDRHRVGGQSRPGAAVVERRPDADHVAGRRLARRRTGAGCGVHGDRRPTRSRSAPRAATASPGRSRSWRLRPPRSSGRRPPTC